MLNRGTNPEAWAATLADENDVSEEIARIRRRLADLDGERARLEREWRHLSQG